MWRTIVPLLVLHLCLPYTCCLKQPHSLENTRFAPSGEGVQFHLTFPGVALGLFSCPFTPLLSLLGEEKIKLTIPLLVLVFMSSLIVLVSKTWGKGKKILCSKLLKTSSQTALETYQTTGYIMNRSTERHIKMFGGQACRVVPGPSPPHLQSQ